MSNGPLNIQANICEILVSVLNESDSPKCIQFASGRLGIGPRAIKTLIKRNGIFYKDGKWKYKKTWGSIFIDIDSRYRMARIVVNDKVFAEGNFWEFNQIFLNLKDYGRFNSLYELAENVKTFLEGKSDIKYTIIQRTYIWNPYITK